MKVTKLLAIRILGVFVALLLGGAMLLVSGGGLDIAYAQTEPREIEIVSVVIADKIFDGGLHATAASIDFGWVGGLENEHPPLLFAGRTGDGVLIPDYTVTAEFAEYTIGQGIAVTVTVELSDTPWTAGFVLVRSTFVTTGNIVPIPTERCPDFVELQMNILSVRRGAVLRDTMLPNGWQWQNPDTVIASDTESVVAMWVPSNANYATAFREIAIEIDSEIPVIIIAGVAVLAAIVLAMICILITATKKRNGSTVKVSVAKGDSAEQNYTKYMK